MPTRSSRRWNAATWCGGSELRRCVAAVTQPSGRSACSKQVSPQRHRDTEKGNSYPSCATELLSSSVSLCLCGETCWLADHPKWQGEGAGTTTGGHTPG